MTCFAVTESNSLSHASHVCFRLKGQVVRLCSLFFECFAVAASLPHMEGPHECLEDTMDCEDADSSYKEPVEKKPRIDEDAALTNEGPTQSSTKREGDGDGADENEPAAKRYRPRSSRSRSPCPGLPNEAPHQDRFSITRQRGIICAVCQQEVPETTGWENWVYMAPGSWEHEEPKPGMDLLRRVVSMVEFPEWIHVEQAWCGVYGTFMPLCKWCMCNMAEKLPEMNEYVPQTATEGANATNGTNRTVTKERAIIAGLICQQLRAKVKDAKRNVEDMKAAEAREEEEKVNKLHEDLHNKCAVCERNA